MSNLEDACEAATQRKQAAIGENASLRHPTEFMARAVFSGFDIDHDELNAIARRVSYFFAALTIEDMAVHEATASSWIDGFLVGLMLGSQSEN